jgi:hypothetical protein
MYTTTITENTDYSFPFSRELFEEPKIVYHGTWSIYSERIESAGFGGFALPFDHKDFETIANAWRQVGIRGSYVRDVFSARTPGRPRTELSMTGGFWDARAYATDGGGEVVRMMLEEARDFEALCSEDAKRLALKLRWEEGLRKCPDHALTLRAVEVLADEDGLQATGRRVTQAREAIEGVVRGGYPIVYAISVEPQWFVKTWEAYLWHWENESHGAVELRCFRDLVTRDRIRAKAMFPNGTDPDFRGDWIRRWADVEALAKGN